MQQLRRLARRGTNVNPATRYDRSHVEPDMEGVGEFPDAPGATPTVLYRDASRGILATNDSPDIAFRFSVNPYRGCEHGCIYCYARPTHEYLSLSAGLDFERRIVVKTAAPELLRKAFLSPRWQPQTVALSGNTDCYQPVERQLQVTRRTLEVFREFRNPVSIVTKSALVTRDVDILSDLATYGAIEVRLSVTTLSVDLARRMEPWGAPPRSRLHAVRTLNAAGIPTGVIVAPVIPGLTDEEIPAIVGAAAAAGARSVSWQLLRLPPPVDELFAGWLAEHYRDRRERVLGRLRACRGGELSDARFDRRLHGLGVYAAHIKALFELSARRHSLDRPLPPLNTAAFRRPLRSGEQLRLC
ncbi:MAG: PA0069 family radical SAM protein [Candidatus Binatia bacterium]